MARCALTTAQVKLYGTPAGGHPCAGAAFVEAAGDRADHRATKITHLEDAVGALSAKLTPAEITHLEEPYVPHRVIGHQ